MAEAETNQTGGSAGARARAHATREADEGGVRTAPDAGRGGPGRDAGQDAGQGDVGQGPEQGADRGAGAGNGANGAAEAAPVAEPSGAPAPDAPAEDPAALRAERDAMRDRFMRALAEAENVRKRAERDRREAEAYGGSRLARDLLPVFDNLARALETVTDEQRAAAGPLIEGVELTLRSLEDTLGRHGVASIAPEVGERFDPQRHEAMFEAPVPGTKAGDIIQVMTRGFVLHDRLLRPAQVGVSSTPAS